MTKEQMDRWIALGFPFDEFTKGLAKESFTQSDTLDSATILIEGYWSSDRNGKQRISHANLGTTVYFNVITNYKASNSLKFLLYDKDGIFNADDRVMSTNNKNKKSKQVEKSLNLTNGKGIFSLFLEEDWQKMIIAEKIGVEIELYWRVFSKDFERTIDSVLNVARSFRDLYINPPTERYPFPEMLSEAGEIILFAMGDALKVNEFVAEKLDKERFFIGARALSVGKLVANNLEVYKSQRIGIYNMDIYNNEAKSVEISRASNFGFKNIYVENGRPITTKGLSQIDYFSNRGVINNGLKIAKNIIEIWDFTALKEILFKDGYGTIPTPFSFGWAIEILTAFVIVPAYNEMREDLNNARLLDFEKSKLLGLVECLRIVKRYEKELGLRSTEVFTSTLRNLLSGKFTNFKEVVNDTEKMRASTNSSISPRHTVIYRQITDTSRDTETFIIECIFLNNKILNNV